MNLVLPPLCQRKLLKCCPQEQELYALVNCVILNGESPYLRSSRLWMVVGNKLFFGGPKLRQRVPLRPSHRRYVPSPLPDDAAQLPNRPLTSLPISTPIFAQKCLSSAPDCLNPSPTQPATSHSVPQLPYKAQTKLQAPEDDDDQRRILCETGREELSVQKMNPRFAHPRIASTYTSSGTFQLQGYLPPTRHYIQSTPQNKKIHVSHILRRKSPPPPRPSR